MSPRIGIVGGSITGLALHLFLKQYGIGSTVFEAARPEFSRSGGVFGLGGPALTALERVGVTPDSFVTVTNQRVDEWVPGQPAPRRSTYPGFTVTWNALHDALAGHVSDQDYRMGRKVVGLSTDGSGVRLAFDGGGFADVDMVIGADGRNSTMRKLVDPNRRVHYADYVMFRGLTDECPPEHRNTFVRHLSDKRTQFDTFPVDGGKRMDWVLHLPVTRDEYRWMFNGADPEIDMFMPKGRIKDRARSFVDGWARDVLPALERDVILRTTYRMALPVIDVDLPTTMRFGQGKVFLIGDSLAPVRSHTARGANNGLEQADDLSATLYQVIRYGADQDAALEDFEGRHLPRVQDWVRMGPELAKRKIVLRASNGWKVPTHLVAH